LLRRSKKKKGASIGRWMRKKSTTGFAVCSPGPARSHRSAEKIARSGVKAADLAQLSHNPPGAIAFARRQRHRGGAKVLRCESNLVQLEGRKRITAREFANGARLAPGDRFIAAERRWLKCTSKIAFEVLRRVEAEGAYASDVLHAELGGSVKPEDAALATELTLGVLRWRALLDFLLERQLKKPVRASIWRSRSR
jgi:hypothetical protein